jgi:hypothetical protein
MFRRQYPPNLRREEYEWKSDAPIPARTKYAAVLPATTISEPSQFVRERKKQMVAKRKPTNSTPSNFNPPLGIG